MKLIVDIDDELVETAKFAVRLDMGSDYIKCIANGTPLPKGHGRLIDADVFIETMKDASKRHKYKEVLIDDCLTVDDVFKAIIESLQNEGLANGDAPTIIEADKKESEEKSCDNCKWNKTDKCQPSTCAMMGCDGHGLWERVESEDKE